MTFTEPPHNAETPAAMELPSDVSGKRLNKVIADSGLCSRRDADRLIQGGVVTVNGAVVTQLGTRIHPVYDKVTVAGKPLPTPERYYVLFHKPKDCITTRRDEKGRKTIYDYLPKQYADCDPAGRLDRNTTGALILSNDGDFLHRITHPSFHVSKVYRVMLDRSLSDADAQRLVSGVLLEPEGVMARMESIVAMGPAELEITLKTGYNRQIRRSFEGLRYEVASLQRLSIGPVQLERLKPGGCRLLEDDELRQLLLLQPSSHP